MPTEEASAAAAATGKKDKGKQGGGGENVVIPPKKPKLTKAERRALQEKQRAEKAARSGGGAGGGGGGGKKKQSAGGSGGGAGGKTAAHHANKPEATKKSGTAHDRDGGSGGGGDSAGVGEDEDDKTLQLFAHLPQYSHSDVPPQTPHGQPLHPAIVELGRCYADGSIRGANARCRAMMEAFKRVIRDYETPPGKLLSQDLDTRVKAMFQHLTTCRPHSVSMGNAVTFLKIAIANLDRDATDDEARSMLCEQIDAYVRERITFAGEAIANHARGKIHDGDVILVYGKGELMERILLGAHDGGDGASFRVIVVDSRPLMEGREMLEALRRDGIDCTYILLNAVSYVMKEVTKVFLGAAALMSNGSVLSRVGTAALALLAQSANVPVLVCCETYKISNRVQLESITGNELGNPDDVAQTGKGAAVLSDWKMTPNLKLLNLLYDLTPSEYVSGIVTELGVLPPTSVAVIIREMNPQDNADVYR